MHIPQININYIQVMSMKVILCNAIHCMQILNTTDLISLLLIYPCKNTVDIFMTIALSSTTPLPSQPDIVKDCSDQGLQINRNKHN